MKRLLNRGILVNRGIFLSLVAVSSLLTSCASMLGIGHDHFECAATQKGGVCASVHQVYEERYKLANQGKSKKSNEESVNEGSVKVEGKKAQLTVKVIKQKPYAKPVRIPPEVVKIWIQPYVDRHGDLVDGRYIYAIVKRGGWLLPNGTRIYDTKKR